LLVKSAARLSEEVVGRHHLPVADFLQKVVEANRDRCPRVSRTTRGMINALRGRADEQGIGVAGEAVEVPGIHVEPPIAEQEELHVGGINNPHLLAAFLEPGGEARKATIAREIAD
jgi:hypothetical protein